MKMWLGLLILSACSVSSAAAQPGYPNRPITRPLFDRPFCALGVLEEGVALDATMVSDLASSEVDGQ